MKKVRMFFKNLNISHIVIAATVTLLGYMFIQYINTNKNQPIRNGFIQDVEKVDLATQEKMELASLEKAFEASKNNLNESMVTTLFYCINTAKINDNYDCLVNTMNESARKELLINPTNTDYTNEGLELYNIITNGRILTGIQNEIISNSFENAQYKLTFLFLDGSKDIYNVALKEGTFTKFLLESRSTQ